jgi:hypothetical protein
MYIEVFVINQTEKKLSIPDGKKPQGVLRKVLPGN